MSETRDESSSSGPPTAKDIFLDLVELPADQRAAEFEQRTSHDPELRAAVQSLLDAHDRAGGFLREPTVEQAQIGGATATLTEAPPAEQRRIGPYKILQEIGEGGFGTVYMAEQEHPVRRRVALKLIKVGMDTRQVIARFDAERQALAIMDHPHIARVFDAGQTDDGRPYFVMELVKGVPITEYCDQANLGIRARLELFAQVCQAVQHAHQKGVIHRDLKPSNILVSLQDDKPLAKVIDFGIAKATQARLTEKTLFTEFRQLIGTPEYMSPEQAEGSLDIDTRTDVYALGVLLYELLTGTTPFDARELRSKAYGEMQRVIREVDPPKPSTRLSAMRETIGSVAARRGLEPRKLGTIVRGDLDWIVMKALEKDRSRRYETANGLAADIQRFLSDEPVSAGPPGGIYRARKFVRRHRVGMTTAALLLAALAVGLIGTSWGFVTARRERDAAIQARNQAEAARVQAEAARRAEAEAREFEAGTDKFLLDMFESIDPTQARGKPVLVQDILDRAVKRLEASPPAHRKPEGSLRFVFGIAYRSLGLLEPAHAQLEKAAEIYLAEWGEGDFRTAKVLNALGQLRLQMGKLEASDRALRRAVQINRTLHGPDHVETIATENALADLLMKQGKLADADALLAELLPRVRRVRGEGSDDALSVLSVYSGLKAQQGRYLEAEQLLRDAVAAAVQRYGEDHPYTLSFRHNLADLLRTQGRVAEAEPLQRQVLETSRRVMGPDHPTTLSVMNNLALTLDALGKFEEAETIYLDVIERRKRVLGEEHASTLTSRNNYALLLQNTGRFDQAEPIFRDVVARGRRAVGEDHPSVLLWTNNLAWLLVQRGDAAGGEAIYRELVPRVRQLLGDRHPTTVSLLMRHGHSLALQERYEDAEPLLAEAHVGAVALGIADHQAGYAVNYGLALVRVGKLAEALPLLLQADAALARAPLRDPAAERRIADALFTVYEKLGPPEAAEHWRHRAATLPAVPAIRSPIPPAATQP